MGENKLAIFEGKRIRKTIHDNEWWFSIIDVIEVLTDSSIPKRYWSDLKRKLVTEGYSQLYEKIVQLKFSAADGEGRNVIELVAIGPRGRIYEETYRLLKKESRG